MPANYTSDRPVRHANETLAGAGWVTYVASGCNSHSFSEPLGAIPRLTTAGTARMWARHAGAPEPLSRSVRAARADTLRRAGTPDGRGTDCWGMRCPCWPPSPP